MDRFEQSREGRRASIHGGIISSVPRQSGWGLAAHGPCASGVACNS
jgi:hypothetical protein